MSATNSLREDHKQIRRLDKVILKCYTDLYAGKNIPIPDLEKITIIIEEFFDSIDEPEKSNEEIDLSEDFIL